MILLLLLWCSPRGHPLWLLSLPCLHPPCLPHVPLRLQPVQQLTPLDGEERMWDTVEQRNVRWGRLVATVALLAGGGFLLGRAALLRQQQGAGLSPAAAPPAAVAARAAAPVVQLSRSEAASVIGRWQGIKAAALGPEHDIGGLGAILRGDVLGQWQERAQQIQKKGWWVAAGRWRAALPPLVGRLLCRRHQPGPFRAHVGPACTPRLSSASPGTWRRRLLTQHC